MRGKQYKRAQLEWIEHLFKLGKNASEVGEALGITSTAARKLRHRMRQAGWNVGEGSNLHPMPGPEVRHV
jgi:hypothetical protein